MKKTLKLFVVAISMMSLTQTKAGIEAFCFTDIYGYIVDMTATRTGPGYWELIGFAEVGDVSYWDMTGYYDKESDIWSITFHNPAPDGCGIWVDSATYISTSYGGGTINFNWTSYCFGTYESSGFGSTNYTQGHCVFKLGESRPPAGLLATDPEINNIPVVDLHSIEGGTIFGDLFEEETLTVVNTGENNIGINYEIVSDTKVTINIYNQVGQLITTVVNENKIEGYYTATWNSANALSGMYIVELKTDVGSVSSKFVK